MYFFISMLLNLHVYFFLSKAVEGTRNYRIQYGLFFSFNSKTTLFYSSFYILRFSPYQPSSIRPPNVMVAVDKESEERRRLKIVELLRGLFGHVKVSMCNFSSDVSGMFFNRISIIHMVDTVICLLVKIVSFCDASECS